MVTSGREPSISTARRLVTWEQARERPASLRPAIILAVLERAPSLDAAMALPLGHRDGRLLDLRMDLYGTSAPTYLECPQCGEGMENDIDLRRIRLPTTDPGPGPHAWSAGPLEGRLRLPTTHDLVAAASAAEPALARNTLLQRIVTELRREGDPVAPERLPAQVVEVIEGELERLDPQAYIVFSQRCPSCDHPFEAPFDIASYLWHELDVDARRIFQEIDLLARAYGWTETEILALSDARRGHYIEMVVAR